MMNTSFYLNDPKAKKVSKLYISLSSNGKRLRFSSGFSFLISHCNLRQNSKKKLLIKGMPLYFEYQKIMNDIEYDIQKFELELINSNKEYDIETIKDLYIKKYITKIESNQPIKFFEAFDRFIEVFKSGWVLGRYTHFIQLRSKLEKFEALYGKLDIRKFDSDKFRSFRDDYLIGENKLNNNSANNILKRLKQFLAYGLKQNWGMVNIDFTEIKPLDVIEPYKIALQINEITDVINLNLDDHKLQDKVRDLFILEVLTGQRFSDIEKVLEPSNINNGSIHITPKKTGKKVSIPLHPDLLSLLSKFDNKYKGEIPVCNDVVFNKEIKNVFKKAGINREHSWQTKSGKTVIDHKDFRYNLISSHTGRRTFCTLAIQNRVPYEIIMKVTGHKNHKDFSTYVKVDDMETMNNFDAVFQSAIEGNQNK